MPACTVVDGTRDIVRSVVGEGVEVAWERASEPLPVELDPALLEQSILNLVVSARDAVPGGGLAIAVRAVDLDEDSRREHPPHATEGQVEIAVSATPPATVGAQPRSFAPRATTAEQATGLAVVFLVARQSGGVVRVESDVAGGASFRMYLPRASAPASRGTTLSPAAPRGGDTVLLVDDEPAVRAVARRILVRAGYRVIEAADGAEALALWKEQRAEIDVLVTDVVMPHMSGIELSRHVRAIDPHLPLVVMSGYADDELARSGPLDEEASYLEKPLTPATLLGKVREALVGRVLTER